MTSFKHHLSFILPLMAFLISFQFLFSLDRVSKEYEKSINNGYSIIIATLKEPDFKKLKSASDLIDSIEEISPDIFLKKLENNFSPANLALLKVSLPKFYRIKLSSFPSSKALEKIESKLKQNDNIKRVETYAQTHREIFSLLQMIGKIITLFTVLITGTVVLLVVKQIEVWRFEHYERMEVMALFGAPYWMRSATLFKLAFIDSIISVALVGGIFFYIQNSGDLIAFLDFMMIDNISFYPVGDIVTQLGLAFAVSFGSVFFVIIRQKEV